MIQIFNLREIGKQIMMHPHNGHSITFQMNKHENSIDTQKNLNMNFREKTH